MRTVSCYVNIPLARERGIPELDIIKIHSLQEFREELQSQMQDTDEENKSELRRLFKLWKDNEFKLQSLWRFEVNEKWHKDFLLPHCNCPVYDNYAVYPELRHVSKTCVYHGNTK